MDVNNYILPILYFIIIIIIIIIIVIIINLRILFYYYSFFHPRLFQVPTCVPYVQVATPQQSPGGTQKRFIQRGSAPRSNPLIPFYITFLTKKVPLSYSFHWQVVPLSVIPSLELWIPFNCCKQINHYTKPETVFSNFSHPQNCFLKPF